MILSNQPPIPCHWQWQVTTRQKVKEMNYLMNFIIFFWVHIVTSAPFPKHTDHIMDWKIACVRDIRSVCIND